MDDAIRRVHYDDWMEFVERHAARCDTHKNWPYFLANVLPGIIRERTARRTICDVCVAPGSNGMHVPVDATVDFLACYGWAAVPPSMQSSFHVDLRLYQHLYAPSVSSYLALLADVAVNALQSGRVLSVQQLWQVGMTRSLYWSNGELCTDNDVPVREFLKQYRPTFPKPYHVQRNLGAQCPASKVLLLFLNNTTHVEPVVATAAALHAPDVLTILVLGPVLHAPDHANLLASRTNATVVYRTPEFGNDLVPSLLAFEAATERDGYRVSPSATVLKAHSKTKDTVLHECLEYLRERTWAEHATALRVTGERCLTAEKHMYTWKRDEGFVEDLKLAHFTELDVTRRFAAGSIFATTAENVRDTLAFMHRAFPASLFHLNNVYFCGNVLRNGSPVHFVERYLGFKKNMPP